MKRANGGTATKAKATTTKAKAAKSKAKKPVEVVDSENGEEDIDEVEEVAPAKKPRKKTKPKEDRTPAEQAKADAFRKFITRDNKPKKLGQKKVPQGAPNCFEGKTFVVTGVLEYFDRKTIEGIVEQYGGNNGKTLTKKTSYLIVGRDVGEAKINKAEQYMVPQISEDEFLALIRKSNKDAGEEDDDEEEAGSEEEKDDEDEEKDDEEEEEEDDDEDDK